MAKDKILNMSDQAKRLNMIFKDFEGAIRPFAATLGVSSSSAFRMLHDQQPISFEVINNISQRLGYNPEWFIKGTGAKKQKAEERGKILTDIQEFNTVLDILRKRLEVQDMRIKWLENEIEELKQTKSNPQ